jgi:TRAP-type mannitol/chloroaromatic compound transport system permease large subunit
MIEISPVVVTIVMLGGLVVMVLTGFPLAMPIGTIGLAVGLLAYGTPVFAQTYQQIFAILSDYILLALPLFVFMGVVLEHSLIADKMYDALFLLLSGFRGGLALVTLVLGTVLAACVGVVTASVTMLTAVALPAMVKRGYDKSLVSGVVCAGGTLGILIPPSVMLVVYGPMARVSVGGLFFGAMGPGLLLSALYRLSKKSGKGSR